MFRFLKQRKYKTEVLSCLYALLRLYPLGRDKIIENYPGIDASIETNFANGTTAHCAALFIAASVLTDVAGSVSAEQNAHIAQQLHSMDMRQIKAMLNDVKAGKPIPQEIFFATLMYGDAIMAAKTLVDNKNINQGDYDLFISEISGALSGKSAQERSANRTSDALDEAFPLPELREGDDGPLLPKLTAPSETPPLSGTDVEVNLVPTATGIALVRKDDGIQITERRTLSQDDLQKVPSGLGVYRFVNFCARSGEIYSCIIAGKDAEIFGNMRAFWWSLAKVNVENTNRTVRRTRMTASALARVHQAARWMWDTAIKEAGSIDNMRDLLMPSRNMHLEVIAKLKSDATNEAERLGLDIAFAMVLATQSEDQKLEAFAYRCFKEFIWRPGEEPKEFWERGNASIAQ